jgi:large exoprotein involved in heme utilization and adhesion
MRSAIITESFETRGNSGPVKITAPSILIGGSESQQTIVTSTHSFSGDPNSGHGGNIEITGTDVTLTSLARLESVADSTPETFSLGGDMRITGAERIVLEQQTSLLTSSTSSGHAGNIKLKSPQVTIRDQSTLASETFGRGNGGTIRVSGSEAVALESGSTISTTAVSLSDGHAGHIELNTPNLAIRGGSTVRSETAGSGPGGTITVQNLDGATRSVLIDGAGSGIFTDTQSTSGDGAIQGNGSGGSILVNADSVTIQNKGVLSAKTSGAGNAGDILVRADSVKITGGSQLTSSSSTRQTPLVEGEVIPSPTGNAGRVTVEGSASSAQSLLIDGAGSGIFTHTENTGAAGNIFVDVQSITLQNSGQVTSSSIGRGNAGNIDIRAGQSFLANNGSVTTQAEASSGGAIKITTNPSGSVQLTNSMISASVLDGTGGGGSVNIDPQFVLLQNSQILAQAVQGPGGNIFITTNLLLPDANSLISASSQFGQQGTITIQSPISPASGKIVPLSQKPLIATTMMTQRCAALAGGEFSSLTVAGRDSLPAEPGGWLASPLATLESGLSGSSGLSGLSGAFGSNNEIDEIDQTNEIDQMFLSLRKIAPPGFLTEAFAADPSSQCHS